MKSLVEILSESMFDKGLIEKDITFGQVFELDGLYFGGSDGGVYAFNEISVSKLKKDFPRVPKELEFDDVSYLGADDTAKNKLLILNTLLYIIGSFDLSTKYDEKITIYQYYSPDKFQNDLMSNLSIYLLKTISKYTTNNKVPYISMVYDASQKEQTIRIGKYNKRGPNPYVAFKFKKK